MKKYLLVIGVIASMALSTNAMAYNFGDFRSETLTGKAWGALSGGDIEAVLAYTNKNLELYGEQAKDMQGTLSAYPTGSNEEIFTYWALNDVATSLFIQGEAYRKAEMNEEAKEVYSTLINDYTYGQAWDSKGWFWKPAEAALEKLALLESGASVDFGDYTSSHLTTQAWKALGSEDTASVLTYTAKVEELYADKAQQMQNSLTEYPWESNEKIFSYWALNDMGSALYVKGEALKKAGQKEEAIKAYKQLVDNYYYAQCWDPQGWFWKPAEAAQQALSDLEEL